MRTARRRARRRRWYFAAAVLRSCPGSIPPWQHDRAVFRQTCGFGPTRGRDASRQANWSIRVPCPGGRGATCVGFGVRVPSAAAPFCTSGVLSGALNTGTSGGLTTTVAGTAEIFIGSVLLVASDTGRLETNDW